MKVAVIGTAKNPIRRTYMRQHGTPSPTLHLRTVLEIFLASAWLFLASCVTAPVQEFSRIKPEMTKDDVLELVGSPNRTERIDGKEKWAYRYYTGENKNIETLRQVTFLNGKVLTAGEDTEEVERVKQINSDDAQRAERRKNYKLPPESNLIFTPSGVVQPREDDATKMKDASKEARDLDDEPPPPRPRTESDFKEMKGRRGGPVDKSQKNSQDE